MLMDRECKENTEPIIPAGAMPIAVIQSIGPNPRDQRWYWCGYGGVYGLLMWNAAAMDAKTYRAIMEDN